MKNLIGSPGTVSGLILRFGQCTFAAVSIGVMLSAPRFSTYTAFCYLIASMGLQMMWSFGLACLDFYALRRDRDLRNPILLSLFLVGDMVTATLTLAAACSSAGLIVLFTRDLDCCKADHLPCTRLQLSIASAFLTWSLIATSSYVMFWILSAV